MYIFNNNWVKCTSSWGPVRKYSIFHRWKSTLQALPLKNFLPCIWFDFTAWCLIWQPFSYPGLHSSYCMLVVCHRPYFVPYQTLDWLRNFKLYLLPNIPNPIISADHKFLLDVTLGHVWLVHEEVLLVYYCFKNNLLKIALCLSFNVKHLLCTGYAHLQVYGPGL